MLEAKKVCRDRVLEALKNMTPEVRREYETSLLKKVSENPSIQQAKTIGITLSMAHEVETGEIIDYLLKQGKNILIPKTLPKREMAFAPYEGEETLLESAYGVMEPLPTAEFVDKNEIDVILVPGLVFTPNGDRLGHGGGYYDRYLATYTGKTVSLAFPEMIQSEVTWPVEPHDIAVQEMIIAEK